MTVHSLRVSDSLRRLAEHLDDYLTIDALVDAIPSREERAFLEEAGDEGLADMRLGRHVRTVHELNAEAVDRLAPKAKILDEMDVDHIVSTRPEEAASMVGRCFSEELSTYLHEEGLTSVEACERLKILDDLWLAMWRRGLVSASSSVKDALDVLREDIEETTIRLDPTA